MTSTVQTFEDSIIPDCLSCFISAKQYIWHVNIGAENGKSHLTIFADQDGVCEFYRLRDAPMAGGRRAALRHFVDSYTRKPKNQEVRAHFRGREEFSWFGLSCSVNPPLELIEKAS